MKHIFSYWIIDWSSAIAAVMLLATFFLLSKHSKKIILAALIFILALCFFSPLHVLAANYLFSAHMIVHVVLLLCVGPLLVLTLHPDENFADKFFLYLKSHPILGWLTGVGIMWFWHIPVIFNNAMASMHNGSFSYVSLDETLSLVIAGILFSAPVIHPNKKYRIEQLQSIVYLFTACVGCSLLGLLITFAPGGTYHHFLSQHDSYYLNNIILHQWNITQAMDQQAAGLIMWVPCCLIYVSGAMYLLIKWLKQKDEVFVVII
jgi:putative membrane protein